MATVVPSWCLNTGGMEEHAEQSANKVVVTGGAGFIGSHLVERLLATSPAHVVVVDNLSRGRLAHLGAHRTDTRLQFVKADIRDPAGLEAAVEGAGVIYHLAAQSTVMGAMHDPAHAFTTNVIGTFNVLRAAVRCKVAHVIFASSRQVYGEPIRLPVEENDPLMAINSYGASKVAGEAFCRAFRREFGLHTTILRFANVYGPRDVGRVIPLWVDRAAHGRVLEIYGGEQIVDFVWIDQAVEALVRAVVLGSSLPPINVASGTGTRIVDLARRIAALASAHVPIAILPPRSVEVTRFVANVDRMRQLLQIEPPLDPLVHLPKLLSPLAESATRAGVVAPAASAPTVSSVAALDPPRRGAAAGRQLEAHAVGARRVSKRGSRPRIAV
ncbi:MAG: SDR family NAD(P)-dependent oxidoreductase [Chloroflexi bacterium]|nr:SDR family NAD(P)-dependent oxidoreductase [Chloroflexota bacterium]